jgi:hypothetical protein
MLSDVEENKNALEQLILENESRFENPWKMSSLTNEYVENMMKKVVPQITFAITYCADIVCYLDQIL